MVRKPSVFAVILILSLCSLLYADVFLPDYTSYDGHRTTVNAVAFSPDGKLLVAAGGENEIAVWDVNSKKLLDRFGKNPQNKPINFIDTDRRGRLIAAVGFMDKTVKIYRLPNGTLLHSLPSHNKEYSSLAFSPVDDVIAVTGTEAGNRMSIKLWNPKTGKLIKTLYRSTQPVNREYLSGIQFSPDGKLLACGISNTLHGVKVWKVSDGTLLQHIHHNADVSAIDFNPDGSILAGGGTDRNVTLWDISSGRAIRTLTGLKGYISCMDFSPDGKYLAAGGMDYRSLFKLWDVNTGRLLQSVDISSSGINSISFSPDGNSLALGMTTRGDLFKIATVRMFHTAAGFQSVPWHRVNSSRLNMSLEFPSAPEIKEYYKEDAYYAYSTYSLSQDAKTFYLRVVHYKYRIDGHKKNTQIERTGRQMVSAYTRKGAKLVSSKPFSINRSDGREYILNQQKGRNNLRIHLRVFFVGNNLYEMRYLGYDNQESPMEKRFFGSFSVKD